MGGFKLYSEKVYALIERGIEKETMKERQREQERERERSGTGRLKGNLFF